MKHRFQFQVQSEVVRFQEAETNFDIIYISQEVSLLAGEKKKGKEARIKGYRDETGIK